MAEKRLTRDGNPVHAKKQKQEQDETSTDLISKEEKMLFSVDRFLRRNSHPLRNIKSKDMSIMEDFFSRALYFIDEAYCSIRRTGNEDIVKVLKDTATMRALIRFASCLRQMREYHLCMKAIRTDLLMKLKNDGTTAFVSSGRSRSRRGKCPRCSLIHAQVSLMPNEKASSAPVQGDNQFSIKAYNMLLIINEILTQMGIQSEVSSRSSFRVSVIWQQGNIPGISRLDRVYG